MTLSAELYRQIVDALKSDSSGDRDKRSAPRVGLRASVRILPAPGARPSFVPQQVRCRNISANGVGLLHTRQMPEGSEFIVWLPASGLATAVCISCIVVHCRRQASDVFSIGARIIRVLSDEEAASLPSAA